VSGGRQVPCKSVAMETGASFYKKIQITNSPPTCETLIQCLLTTK